MSIFALQKVDEVKDGQLSFFKLSKDGRCFYDDFCTEIEKNKRDTISLNRIRTYMNLLAIDNCRLPKVKFNSIKQNNRVIGYEFKDSSLRVYIIKEDPDVYIILGGYKKNQDKDIEKFKRLKAEFLQYKQITHDT